MTSSTRSVTGTCAAALACLAVLVIAGCSTGSPVSAGKTVTIGLTDSGCEPSATSVSSGTVTFAVANAHSAAVTGAQLQQTSGDILGEKLNVAPGVSGVFTLTLQPGRYQLVCPGGSTGGSTTFTVTGTAIKAAPVGTAATAALTSATVGYADYVRDQVAQLVTNTKVFTDAVRSENLAAAEKAYAAPRVNYERIEPVAEKFGDLDPAIDNRIADITAGETWTGFHRLEKAIYKDGSLAGMTPTANLLDTNVGQLSKLVQTQTYLPIDLSNGATSLLDEVGATKITGEEEAYSLIDLVDFEGNVSGSEEAYSLLAPALKLTDPALATQVTDRFAALDTALAAYSTGPAPTDYVTYDKVPLAQHRVLAGLVDAVAEPLAQVGGQLA